MRYKSTRSVCPEESDWRDFEQALFASYAADGGLYIPEYIPKIDLNLLLDMTFPEICAEVIHLYCEIELRLLHNITKEAFRRFNSDYSGSPVALKHIKGNLIVLDASLGPTNAFKDIGQQVIGQLLKHFLSKSSRKGNIIVETSGDTGPAAVEGVRGLSNIQIFCLYPHNRITEMQELQMITVTDGNVHIYRTEGNTDEQASCLKELFCDEDFVREFNILSVNSINWARILTQSSYYIWCYLQVCKKNSFPLEKNHEKINFVVPSGAFGNAMGAYLAKLMGVPVDKIVCATNANDIVHRTIAYGDFRMEENRQVSNLECARMLVVFFSFNTNDSIQNYRLSHQRWIFNSPTILRG